VQGRHVEGGASINVLYVGVRSSLHQQLHTESTVVGEGRVVQGGLPPVVEGVPGYLVLQENVHHHILAVVTGHVEGRTPVDIDCFRLEEGGRGGG